MSIPLDIPISEIPIVCQLTEEAVAARRQTIQGDLWDKVEAKQALADGYAFRFPNTDEIARLLLDFILIERQCCAFFQIELVFLPGNGSIWLHLRGGEDVKQFIEAELLSG